MQKNVLHRYIKVKKAIEGQDFINTWKIKDINVLTSIEILLNGKKFTMYIPSSKTRPRPSCIGSNSKGQIDFTNPWKSKDIRVPHLF